jgi:hypothetical protein
VRRGRQSELVLRPCGQQQGALRCTRVSDSPELERPAARLLTRLRVDPALCPWRSGCPSQTPAHPACASSSSSAGRRSRGSVRASRPSSSNCRRSWGGPRWMQPCWSSGASAEQPCQSRMQRPRRRRQAGRRWVARRAAMRREQSLHRRQTYLHRRSQLVHRPSTAAERAAAAAARAEA